MSFWFRPQPVWWRKALFQIHLWTGLLLSLYVIVVSVSGSAIVFRGKIRNAIYGGIRSVTPDVPPVPIDVVVSNALRAHPGYRISWLRAPEKAEDPYEVWLDRIRRKGDRPTPQDHLIGFADPGSGRLNGAYISGESWLDWLSQLHFDLLAGRVGRTVNAVGGGLLVLMSVTGLIIWWPGIKNWKRGLQVNWQAKWKRVNWDLHSAIGFWTLSLMLVWAFTGFYFGFGKQVRQVLNLVIPTTVGNESSGKLPPGRGEAKPLAELVSNAERATPDRFTTWIGLPRESGNPVSVGREKIVWGFVRDHLAVQVDAQEGKPIPGRSARPGDRLLSLLIALHFGSFDSNAMRVIWVILGLAPAVLTVTGCLMYWNRYLSKTWKKIRNSTHESTRLAAQI